MFQKVTKYYAAVAVMLLLSATVMGYAGAAGNDDTEQKVEQKVEPVVITKTTEAPVLDGKLDDAVWQSAAQFSEFKTFKPDYKKEASQKTTVFMTYDEKNFYFAFRCYDTEPQKIKASLSKRDTLENDDWAGVCLDTFNDHQTGFCFLVNPLGVQTDGMLSMGGDLDPSLDMVWYSKGVVDSEGYAVECSVPIKSIRFPSKKKITMSVMFFRTIIRTSEQTSCPMMTPDKGSLLSQAQEISVSGMKYHQVVEILPAYTYTWGSTIQEGKLETSEKESDISLTTKYGITSDLTLDATYNPDFSQVEADAGQVDVNLRYDLFYDEKRPFFLEGQNIFSFAGNTEDASLVSLIHTRTIVDPLLGLKLSGRMSRKTNFTTLFAIDEFPGKEKDAAGNYLNEGKNAYFSILRFRHSLTKDSYIGGIYTGRDFMGDYNRVFGFDGRLRLTGTSFLEYHAFGSTSKENGNEAAGDFGHAMALRYSYDSRGSAVELGLQDLSDDFRVDTGFITRPGITRLAAFGMLRLYPKSKFFQRIEPFYWSAHIYDKDSSMVETFNLVTFRFWLPRQTVFRMDFIAANEVYTGRRFGRGGYGFQSESQISKHLYFFFFFRRTGAIYYDPENPLPGKGNRIALFLIFQPLEKLNSQFNITYSDFYLKENGNGETGKLYDYLLLRNLTTVQVNKYLFFRGIVEYNTYWKRMTVDFLASFTYIPGTVVHLGYGSIFDKLAWEAPNYVPSDRFLETKRGLFFKVSYLWRW